MTTMPDYVTRDSVLAILRNRYADATDWEHRILERLANDVRDLPAEDVTNVRHGEWLEEPDRYMHWDCSRCGYVAVRIRLDYKYCPHCGARMNGGADGAAG